MGSSCVGVGAGVVRPGEYEAGEVREAGKKRAGTGSSKMVGCRSEMQNATRCQITHHQLSAPASNSNTSDLEVTPGARFSKAPKRISGDIILFVSSKRRRLEERNFAVIFIFIPFTTYEKTSFTE